MRVVDNVVKHGDIMLYRRLWILSFFVWNWYRVRIKEGKLLSSDNEINGHSIYWSFIWPESTMVIRLVVFQDWRLFRVENCSIIGYSHSLFIF